MLFPFGQKRKQPRNLYELRPDKKVSTERFRVKLVLQETHDLSQV